MKAELRPKPHGVLPGTLVIEVWYQGEFIGQVVGADGPGVRFISKYPKKITDPEHGIETQFTGMIVDVEITK